MAAVMSSGSHAKRKARHTIKGLQKKDEQGQLQSGVATETALGFGKGKHMGSPPESNGPHACLSPQRPIPDLSTRDCKAKPLCCGKPPGFANLLKQHWEAVLYIQKRLHYLHLGF